MSGIKRIFKKLVPATFYKVEAEGKKIGEYIRQYSKLLSENDKNILQYNKRLEQCEKDCAAINRSLKQMSDTQGAILSELKILQQSVEKNSSVLKNEIGLKTQKIDQILSQQAICEKKITASQTAVSNEIRMLRQSEMQDVSLIKDALTTKTEKTNAVLYHQYDSQQQMLQKILEQITANAEV